MGMFISIILLISNVAKLLRSCCTSKPRSRVTVSDCIFLFYSYPAVWSLACLIFALFNQGASLMNTRQNIYEYKKRVGEIERGSSSVFENIPMSLRESYSSMLHTAPNHRLDLISLQSSSYFDNILVSTINFLENFVEKTAVSIVFGSMISNYSQDRKGPVLERVPAVTRSVL